MVSHDHLQQVMMRLRYISVIAVIFSGLGSVLMFVIGAVKTVKAFLYYFKDGLVLFSDNPGVVKQAIAYLVQGIDAFLIGLVLMIFSAGVYHLFVHCIRPEKQLLTGQLRIHDIGQLKSIIAELIVIILFVKFLEDLLKSAHESLHWEMLILPVSILLLSLSLRFLDLNRHSREPSDNP